METAAKPAIVQYNDWRQVEVEPLETFTPTLPASVVIPSWQTPPETLARTLAALEGQTCPRDLFEVVIVDDGSEPPLRPPPTPLDVKVVRQERCGFGRSRARNTGARAAAHDILLFLDSDMLVERSWMAAHTRWHHAVSDALTLGRRAHVAMDGIDAETIRRRSGSLEELFVDRPKDPPKVDVEEYLAGTGDLTARADDLFRVMVGATFGIGKGFYDLVGGMDESFVRWGFADTEFGYRTFMHGGLLVPVREPLGWHQGRWSEGRDAKRRSRRRNLGKAAHRIAHPRHRRRQPGRIFAVPQYVVTIDGRRSPSDRIVAAVVDVLADRKYDDLVVRVEPGANGDGERVARLRDEFGPDPRVRVAPVRSALDEFPASPFHVTLPAHGFRGNPVRRLRAELGDAATASAALPDGTTVSITRAWALHRARRTGKSLADFGEARTISAGALKLAKRRDFAAPHEEAYRPARWNRLRDRVLDVRSPSRAGSFVKWAAGAAWRKATGVWRRNR